MSRKGFEMPYCVTFELPWGTFHEPFSSHWNGIMALVDFHGIQIKRIVVFLALCGIWVAECELPRVTNTLSLDQGR